MALALQESVQVRRLYISRARLIGRPLPYFHTMQLKYLSVFFVLSLIFSSPSSSSSSGLTSSQETGLNPPIVTRYRRLSSSKNGRPFPSSDRVYFKKRMTNLDKSERGFKGGRQFSVMLPKGFIPPSDSSLCHNRYPDSTSAYCKLSSAEASSKRSGMV
ncbi:hypothetical protein MLD38_037163 [Melastoma candidum]|uniref:Uncharacterized protein n=1 Tax=Melastoma candidum TaxID=119954 RepID=A0ACB9LLV7_9MYRT|nr:hypothetical protein MLD38_037163 [Melastoma candidum]